MTNLEKIKSMGEEQLAQFLCAVNADVWGYCKAPPSEDDLNINRIWLERETMMP